MAQIQNITLSITRLDSRKSEVTVSYALSFSSLEVLAGAVFTETVSLRGEDLLIDDRLGSPLHVQAIKAQPELVSRSITRRVSNRDLDESREFRILGLGVRRADKVYARVELTPFVPRETYQDSDVVKAELGSLPAR